MPFYSFYYSLIIEHAFNDSNPGPYLHGRGISKIQIQNDSSKNCQIIVFFFHQKVAVSLIILAKITLFFPQSLLFVIYEYYVITYDILFNCSVTFVVVIAIGVLVYLILHHLNEETIKVYESY